VLRSHVRGLKSLVIRFISIFLLLHMVLLVLNIFIGFDLVGLFYRFLDVLLSCEKFHQFLVCFGY